MRKKCKRTNGDGDDGCRGVLVAKLHYYRSPEGDKKRPGNLAIVGYRHPEVALKL